MPVVLDEKSIAMISEIAGGVGRASGRGVGIDALVDRRVVSNVPKAREGVEWAGTAEQVVVILLPAELTAEPHIVVAPNLDERVAGFIGVLREDGGRVSALRRAGDLHVTKWVRFDLNTRNAPIDAGVVIQTVIGKAGKVAAQFVDGRGRDVSNVRDGYGGVQWLECDVGIGRAGGSRVCRR